MNCKRVMIAAPGSGSGKTTVTCALLQTLKEQGEATVSFKCGPDYIDPLYHEKVLGIPSYNLDTFFTGEEQTRKLFAKHAAGADIAVIEGVMGLYDGLGGTREKGSSYHLAKVTKTPVILVTDAKGMGRSVLALLAGFLQYDTEHLIRGVILNRVSGGYYEILKPLIEGELQLPVLGYLPEKERFHVGSRHLGLVMPNELEGIRERLAALSAEFEKTVSLSAVVELAESAGELEGMVKTGNTGKQKDARGVERVGVPGKAEKTVALAQKVCEDGKPIIAVARDEAFCFYYRDNLRLLEENGAELVWFSPLRDEKLPRGCSGLLLGGGYPELYAKNLSQNTAMRKAVKEAVEKGMPVVAECGGFMYLHKALVDQEGNSYAMVGVVDAECYYAGKLVRFGYVEMQEKESRFLPKGAVIKGHEFHYYDSTCNGEDVTAVKPVTGKSYSCIIESGNCFIGFPHLYYPSNPAFVKSFVEKARKYK